MKKIKQKFIIGIIVVVLLLVAGNVERLLVESIQEDIRQEAVINVKNQLRQEKENIEVKLLNDVGTIKAISASLTQEKYSDMELSQYLNYFVSNKNMDFIQVLDSKGRIVSSDGTIRFKGYQSNLEKALEMKEHMSGPFVDEKTGNQVLLFHAPIIIPNKHNGYIVGSKNNIDLQENLLTDFYDGEGYSLIVDNMGKVILSSSILNGEVNSNFFDRFIRDGKNKKSDIQAMNKLKEELSANKTNVVEYNINGLGKYIGYTSLDINSNWNLFCIIDSKDVMTNTMEIIHIVIKFAGTITILFLCLIMTFYCYKRNNNKELHLIFNTFPGSVIKLIFDGNEFLVTYISNGILELSGFTKEEYFNLTPVNPNTVSRLCIKEDELKVMMELKHQCSSQKMGYMEYRAQVKDGSIIWVGFHWKTLNKKGCKSTILGVLTDISQQKHTTLALEKEKERYYTLLSLSDTILFEYNIFEDKMEFSEQVKEQFNILPIIPDFLQVITNNDLIHEKDVEKVIRYFTAFIEGQDNLMFDMRIKGAQGTYVWYHTESKILYNESGYPFLIIGKVTNVDDQKQEKQILKAQAQRDLLTHLYNKMTTQELIKKRVTENKMESGALFIVDIDNFKSVNDQLGHMYGDEALTLIACILKDMFRSTDIVGRIGGDEFIVYFTGWEFKSQIQKKAQDILLAFRGVYLTGHSNYKLTGSIGIAVCPTDGDNYETLFQKADQALYEAKAVGKDCFAFYGNDEINCSS